MVRINLLPVKQIKKRLRTRNEFFAFLGSLIILFAGIALFGAGISMKINGLKAEKKQLENQKASYQQTIKLIDKYKADKVKLEKKLNAIKELKQGSLISVRILDEIANITPNDRLWIQSFSMSQNSIKISGIALDNATIAQYMKSVNNSEYFENATLSGTTHTAVAGRSLKSFSLSFKIIEQSTEKQQP